MTIISGFFEVTQLLTFAVYIRHRRIGAVLFTMAVVTSLLTPNVHILWSSALVYVVVIDLVTRGRYGTAAGIFLLFYAAQFPWVLSPTDLLIPMAVWAVACTGVGFLLQQVGRRITRLQREVTASCEAAELIGRRLRRDIADTLHDDLAADLTHLLILIRQLRSTLPHHYDEVDTIEGDARQALAHLRFLIENLTTSSPPLEEEPSLHELLATSRRALAQRSITLDTDLEGSEHLLPLYGDDASRLLTALIRECTVNALKYSDDGDLLSLVIEPDEERLSLSFTAPWRDRDLPAELHGGHGLYALRSRFARAGGTLVASRVADSWTILATVPRVPTPDRARDSSLSTLEERPGGAHA